MACTATVRGRTAGYLLLCAVLLTAGDAVSMRAAEGRVSPNAASNGMSPQARAYLDHALGLLQEYSIAREHTDWADLRQWTYSLAEGAQTTGGTHRAIDDAARYLNKHSKLVAPEVVTANQAVPPAEVPVPTGRVVSGRLGLSSCPRGFSDRPRRTGGTSRPVGPRCAGLTAPACAGGSSTCVETTAGAWTP
ncbi:hypothetical protein OG937_39140 [Streptomyces sp. NBC_00510]